MGPKNDVLDGGADPPLEGAILGQRGAHCKVSAVSCAKTAESSHLPFGLWTLVHRRKHKFSLIRQLAPMCPHGRAYWHNLANTIEPSVCGGDAVLGLYVKLL